jgi:hypothetical protein
MRKFSLILSVISILFTSSFAQTVRNISTKGIKTLSEQWYNYEEKFGEIIENKSLKYVYSYDRDGNELGRQSSTAGGFALGNYTTEYVRDSEGRVVEKTDFDKHGDISSKIKYQRNGQGNELSNSYYSSEGALKWKIVSTYNKNNHLVEKAWFDAEGSLSQWMTFTYNSNGFESGWSELNSDNILISRCISELSKSGDVLKKTVYNSDNSVSKKYVYMYDSFGNMIEEQKLNQEGTLESKSEYRYDENKRVTELKQYEAVEMFGESQATPVRKYTYRYELY